MKRKNISIPNRDAQIYYAQTGAALATSLKIALCALLAIVPLWWLQHHYGPLAVIITVGAIGLIALVIILISLGAKIADKGQENFIEGIGQLKGALTPAIREEAKTIGKIERHNADLEKRRAMHDMTVEQRQAPQLEDQRLREDWIGADDDIETDMVDGEMYQIR